MVCEIRKQIKRHQIKDTYNIWIMEEQQLAVLDLPSVERICVWTQICRRPMESSVLGLHADAIGTKAPVLRNVRCGIGEKQLFVCL